MSASTTQSAPIGDFAAGRCRFCEREVVTYPVGDPSSPEARRCIHCDEKIAGELRWIDAADLAGLGYDVDSGEAAAAGCATCTSGGGCATDADETKRVRR